jgi:hypothetical protein
MQPYDKRKPVGEALSLAYSPTNGCVHIMVTTGQRPTIADETAGRGAKQKSTNKNQRVGALCSDVVA